MRRWMVLLGLTLWIAIPAWSQQALPGEGYHEHALAVLGPDTWAVANGRKVEIWSLSNLERPVKTLRGPTGNVWSLAASPDGRFLAAGDQDAVVTVWDLETGEVRYSLHGHSFRIWALTFSPDGTLLASGSHDATIKLWDMATGMEVGILEGHESWIRCLTFTPDGELLASSSCDGTVRVWDPETLRQLVRIKAGADGIYSLSFSPDGQYLAWGNYEGEIKLYQVGSWQEVRVFGPGEHRSIYAICFSPDGEHLATGGFTRRLQIWRVADGELLSEYEGHTAQIWGVAYFPGGDWIVTTSKDGTCRVWELGE